MNKNKKLAQTSTFGGWIPREYWSKNKEKATIKCGCCDEKVIIYVNSEDDFIEINGVMAHKNHWKEILGL